jgi:hypothetical protein
MPPTRPSNATLIGSLEIARRDLLDLGLRNTLLNYRLLRGKGVEVVDEKPREIFRLLVREEKMLTFLPGDLAGPAGNGNGAEVQLAQPEDELGITPKHSDSRLKTTHTSAQLQSRLLATYHAARTSMEEQGVNTLYLALARRVVSGAGIQRFGSRIQQAFREAVRLGVGRGLFIKRDDFLWSPAMQQSPIRDRSKLAAAYRKFEFVAPGEIQRAILIVVQASYGIVPEEVPSVVCRLFCLARVTDDMTALVERQCDALLREGRLVLQGVNLVLAQD